MTVKTIGRGIAGVVLMFSIGAGLGFDGGWTATARQFLFDSFQRVKPRQITRLPAVIIDVDERALEEFGQWPWPRTLTARLVEAVGVLEPLAIAFDIIMPEADRLSPANVAALHPGVADSLRSTLAELPSNDKVLGDTLRDYPVVLAWAGLHGEDEAGSTRAESVPVMLEGAGTASELLEFDTVLANTAEVEAGGFGFGLVNTERDVDGVVRQVPLVMSVDGNPVPSLAMEALRVGVGVNWLTLLTDVSGLRGVQMGDAIFETDHQAKLTLYYSLPDPRRRLSAAAVLNGEILPGELAGRIVFIGVTALGLTDVVATPVNARMDGVEVHVQVIENLLDGERLIRPVYAHKLEALVLGVFGILLIFLLPRVSVLWGGLLMIVLVSGLFGVSFSAFAQFHYLFDATHPTTTLIFIYVVLLVSLLAQSNRERRALDAALQQQRLDRARLAGELDAARDIQLGMLPTQSTFEKLPRSIRVHAFLAPAREVGGDLYDVCMLDDRHLFFLVGDVTGKGVPASLFMALSKALCKNVALRTGARVGVIATEVNQAISRENPADLFVTAVAGVIDTKTGAGEFCIAGHDAPMVFKSGSVPLDLNGVGGPPLCVLDDFEYPAEPFTLSRGETLLLWTDGVGEAQAPDTASDGTVSMYGRNRLKAFVSTLGDGVSPVEVVDGIYREVKAFSGTVEMNDDIAIMAIQYTGVSEQ